MTYDQLLRHFTTSLTPLYGDTEARAIAETAVRSLTGWSRTDMLLNGDRTVSEPSASRFDGILARLMRHEPLQYILGETYWHGLTLRVTPDVLIPRPETSELVDIIADAERGRSDLRVIDLCTGSGCIAVALALTLPFPEVTAVDISDAALAVAAANASLCRARVRCVRADVLGPLPFPDRSADIIVSNPPYVAESEKKDMSPNVLDFEPALALFVPDADPLRYYTAIARSARSVLVPGGRLYFEINPLFADPLEAMLRAEGYVSVSVINDIHRRKRFVKCSLPDDQA